jgi:hypothetical protein
MAKRIRVTMTAGPGSGEFFLDRPGDFLVVGRTTDCQVAIPDQQLSRRHFRLAWDGALCQLTDLGSTNGTWVNRQLIQEAILRDGDEVSAGDCMFRIDLIEEPSRSTSTVPPEPAAPRPPKERQPGHSSEPIPVFQSAEPTLAGQPAATPPAGSLLEKLAAAGAPSDAGAKLFAIIDGAQAVELAFTARLMGLQVFTLFSGDMAEVLAHTGPYLVAIDRPLPFLHTWVEALGENAGILLQTNAALDALHAHLREIFVVTDEDGQEYFFRYYDPRVMRTFLPTCTAGELEEFFGVVDRWIVEDESGKAYQVWRREKGGLVHRAIATDAGPAIATEA